MSIDFGNNMGRYYFSKKEETDNLNQINVFFLKKHGYFNPGWNYGTISWSRYGKITGSTNVQSYINAHEQYIKLIYSQTDRLSGEKTDLEYKILLTTTSCYFGGKRHWFICPEDTCTRRVGVLYLNDKFFTCRHCNDLTYNSRNLSGISKVAGQVISQPALEEIEGQIKRQYYAGKQTQKFKGYLKKKGKAFRQLQIVVGVLRDSL